MLENLTKLGSKNLLTLAKPKVNFNLSQLGIAPSSSAPPATPASPAPGTHVMPTSLGGGEFNLPANVTLNTSTRDYAGLDTEVGNVRDHIVPVGLGGVSSPANLQMQSGLANQVGAAGDKDEVELQAMKDYKAGKISLAEARARVMNFQQQQQGLAPTTASTVQPGGTGLFGKFIDKAKGVISKVGAAIAQPFTHPANPASSITGITDNPTLAQLGGASYKVPIDPALEKRLLEKKDYKTLAELSNIPKEQLTNPFVNLPILYPKTKVDPALKTRLEAQGNIGQEKLRQLEERKPSLFIRTSQEIFKVPTLGEERKRLMETGLSFEDAQKKAQEEIMHKGYLPLGDNTSTQVSFMGDLNEMKPAKIPGLDNIDDIYSGKIDPTKLNTSHFNIDETSRAVVDDSIKKIKPSLEKSVGTTLTNSEVLSKAEASSKMLEQAVGREQTLAYESSLLKLRQQIAAEAQKGEVTRDFLENLKTLREQSADIGRKLQSFSIGADPKTVTPMQTVLDAIMKVNDNTDDILKAAQGVDFNDQQAVATFYRQFVKPQAKEWIDLIRYNSMLSSPKTHIINTTSNLLNTSLVAPIEKTISGVIDSIYSGVTGKEQTHFVMEGPIYFVNYFKNLKAAAQRFVDVVKGKQEFTNLDTRNILPATEGVKGEVAKTLSLPTRLLEGADQFFQVLGKGAEEAALNYRASQGVDVGDIAGQAAQDASYRLYRQGLFPEGQGGLLNGMDELTQKVMKLRSSDNPIVSWTAKLTAPFIQVPTNIIKQGLEYSPLGFATAIGAEDKIPQISKAIIGTSVAALTATLLAGNRMTFASPTTEEERTLWKKEGRQAYSIKIGNHWISYTKLPPALSFSLAFEAGVYDAWKNKKISDSTADVALTGLAKFGQFWADQSYLKNFGDFISAVSGKSGQMGWSQVISNYPQQMIPFRALSGWIARALDDTERLPDGKTFFDKQLQQLIMNIPVLREKMIPPRLDETGQPVKAQGPLVNAIAPFTVTKETPEGAAILDNYEKIKLETQRRNELKAKALEDFKPTYKSITDLVDAGKIDEATAKVNGLSDADYLLYKKLKSSDANAVTRQTKIRIYPVINQIRELISQGKQDEAQQLLNGLSDSEYLAYKSVKKTLGF